MATAARRLLAFGAISAALLGAASATAHGFAAIDFTTLVVRASVSESDTMVALLGKISTSATSIGLRPAVVIVAAVSQVCAAPDGSTTVEQAFVDSVTAPHFFTTTVRILDGGAADSTWQAAVLLSVPADTSICGEGEQPAGSASVDRVSGVAFLSPLGLGSPPAGTRIYSFVLTSGHQVLARPQLTYTTA